uniref:DAN domain-containing protein n=1 Tax=Steinernema glaseri TaxID=37863 RepID=A0A1I7YXU3_9BILA
MEWKRSRCPTEAKDHVNIVEKISPLHSVDARVPENKDSGKFTLYVLLCGHECHSQPKTLKVQCAKMEGENSHPNVETKVFKEEKLSCPSCVNVMMEVGSHGISLKRCLSEIINGPRNPAGPVEPTSGVQVTAENVEGAKDQTNNSARTALPMWTSQLHFGKR